MIPSLFKRAVMRIYRKTIPSGIIEKTVELVREYARDINKRAYIFCESKATLSFERALCEKYGGTFSVTVNSFSRYAATHDVCGKYLDKSSATLIVANIIAENRGGIIRLKKNSYDLSLTVFELISQLKAAKIKPEDLDGIIKSESNALTYKLRDVKLIYLEYEKYLKANGFSDDCDILKALPAAFAVDENLRGAKVIIAGVNNFTAQTLDCAVALNTFCDLDCVVLSYDGDSALNESFYKLLSLFPQAKIIDDDTVYSPEIIAFRERLCCEEKINRAGIITDKVKIVEATDPFEEARFVAQTIRREIVFSGRRFKDFAVACPSVKDYESVFSSAFKDYGVCFYADCGRKLNEHPIVAAVAAAIELKRYSLRLGEALALVGVPCAFLKDDADYFKEYVLNNVPARYGLKKSYSDARFESLRKTLVAVTEKLADNGTIAAHIQNISGVLDILGAFDKLVKTEKDLINIGEDASANFLAQGEKAFFDILNRTKQLLGDKRVSLKEFGDLILSSVRAKEIYVLPQYNDGVFLGDYKSVRNYKSKVLFCVGMTSDTPFIKADDSLLCDRELNKMKSFSLIVEPMISVVNRRECENVATTLMSFSEKLYVTYPLLSAAGGKAEKSRLVEYIIKAFAKDGVFLLVSASDPSENDTPIDRYGALGAGLESLCEDSQDFTAGKNADMSVASAFLSVLKDSDPALYKAFINENVESNALKTDPSIAYDGAISPTFIENYYACPYTAFLKNVLRLKQSPTSSIKSYEIGGVLHKALEVFCDFKDVKDNDLEEKARYAAEQALSMPEFSKYSDEGENSFLLGILKNEAIKYCKSVYEESKKSNFIIAGNEISIGGAGEDIPPVTVKTPLGDVVMKGKIDRLDVCETPLGKYAHVIDYKTGGDVESKISMKRLYYGENVQIYLYMGAVEKAGYIPVAIHYCALSDEYKKPTDKNKIYFGYAVDDQAVLNSLDRDIFSIGKSEAYGINLSSGRRSSLLTQEGLKDLIKYAERVSANCASDASKGAFFASPAEEKCKYCEFKGSCRFDGDNAFLIRERLSVTASTVISAVKGENDEEN